jgi:dinuclear metal center YbgI/SA1388 family protein
MERTHLLNEINTLLTPQLFKDYCPNGLQIQGRNSINKIACAVTASLAVIEAATEWGADALLVHHGYFWRGEDSPLVGIKYQRVAALLRADMNLIAYHLPLDAHAQLGNNAQLASVLGLRVIGQSTSEPLVWYGETTEPTTLADFTVHVSAQLGRTPQILAQPAQMQQPIKCIAWCTGGAQDYLSAAAQLGADVYLSGEVSERTYHEARELGMVYLACGHHATERYGVQALGQYLAAKFGLHYRFFDEDNPI